MSSNGNAAAIGGRPSREYKDTVFTDLFYSDETAAQNALSLYNALHGTDITDPSALCKVRLDEVLYLGQHNDAAMLVCSEELEMWEHQSSVNPNMALRLLMYLGREYESLVDRKVRYGTALVKVPTPSFYVFYIGKADAPLEEVQRLSDAYMAPPGECSAELAVKVININSAKGHELLGKCEVLREYSLFVDAVRRHEGKPDGMETALSECVRGGILPEYLKRKGLEVMSMLTAEYDFNEHMQVVQEEAWEDGHSQGLILALRGLMDTMNCSPQEALDAMRIPESERKLVLAGL